MNRKPGVASQIVLHKTVAADIEANKAILAQMAGRSFNMNANHAFTFAVAVSMFSMLVIVGAALLGAYRFLKNVGVFKGHYYY